MSFHLQLQPPPAYDPVKLLRPTELAAAQIGCRVRADSSHFIKADALVVADQAGSGDTGVLIVLPPHDGRDVRILHAMPITPAFTLSLNQTPPSPSTSFFHQSSRPHITLTLSSGLGSGTVELRLAATETVRTQALVSELRRRVELSRARTNHDAKLRHTWMGYYPVTSPADDSDDDDAIADVDAAPDESSSSVATPSTSTAGLTTPLTALTLPPDVEDEEDVFPNPYLPTFSRTAFLRKRVFAKQEQWSSRIPLKIRLATYNVNDKLPPKDSTELAPLVGHGEEDLLVFGFQEVDLRSSALLVSQGAGRADEWEAAILRGLGDKAVEFEKLAVTQFVGVMTIVLVRKSLREAVSQVQTSERGIGLLGFGGNKAVRDFSHVGWSSRAEILQGVAVRMKIHDTTLCFVNSHLAAFSNALDRRRTDYATLLKGLTFPRPIGEDVVPALEEFLPNHPDRLLSIEDSHVLFWLGDLNYRVAMEDDILRAWVTEKRWQAILDKDQLHSDIASGKSFAGFNEHKIDFPPTFKYVHGSTTLDLKRAPAYTDRILWTTPIPPTQRGTPLFGVPTVASPGASTSPGPAMSTSSSVASLPRSASSGGITRSTSQSTIPGLVPRNWPVDAQSYSSHEILWSDHRPVSAVVQTEVRSVDVEKRAECLTKATNEVEKLEEIYRPALDSETSVDFGAVRLRQRVMREIVVRNTGRVPASFTFRAPAPGKPICKDLFWVFPSVGTVPPGEEWRLQVAVFVDESWAPRLTLGEEMNDVLVLQVTDGKDIFITLQGIFEPTILGLPLVLLPALPGPIRNVPLAQRKAMREAVQTHRPELKSSASASASTGEEVVVAGQGSGAEEATEMGSESLADEEMKQEVAKQSAKPAKEMWRLLEFLMERGVGTEELWVGEVPDTKVLSIVERLDTSSEMTIPDDASLAVSQTVLYLLGNLPEPLLPLWLQPVCLGASDRDEAFAALEGVAAVNTNVLIGLMSVAKLCLQQPPTKQGRSTTTASDDGSRGSLDEASAALQSAISSKDPSTAQLDALANAVFGWKAENAEVPVVSRGLRAGQAGLGSTGTREGRRRFVRLLLEG